MITVSNLGMQFGGQWLFQHVDLQFLPGNCYGIIGANGAGKSTFLRILTGELDSTTGSVNVDPDKRVSVLKQNQNAYDEYTIMDTVIMGNQHLYDVMKEKDAIYEKPDFSDEDGLRAADLEAEFAELGGWEAESDASRLLQGLGIGFCLICLFVQVSHSFSLGHKFVLSFLFPCYIFSGDSSDRFPIFSSSSCEFSLWMFSESIIPKSLNN